MRNLLRPIIFFAIFSFLIGLWLKIKDKEKSLYLRLRDAPSLTLLTDDPSVWKPVIEKARQEGIAKIQIESPQRKNWNPVSSDSNCDLVNLKSYYLSDFLSRNWLRAMPEQNQWWELIHPDFKKEPLSKQFQFLPLLWSIASWSDLKSESKTLPALINTSLDEALLVGLEEAQNDEPNEESDGLDPAESLWNRAQKNLDLGFLRPDTHIPLTIYRGSLNYSLEPDNQASQKVYLSTWGIGFCPNFKQEKSLIEFVSWLLETENLQLLKTDNNFGLTTTSSEHGPYSDHSPKRLREFSLQRMSTPELPWDYSAVWSDLIKQQPDKTSHTQ